MTKTKIAFAFLSFIFLALAFSNIAKAEDSQPKVLAELKDKSAKEYEFKEQYELTKSSINYTYYFVLKGSADNAKVIFTGKTYTDGENCPSKEYLKIHPKISKAILSHHFIKKDFNGDQTPDLDLSIIEKDCKTGKLSFTDILLFSTDNGFETKQFQRGE